MENKQVVLLLSDNDRFLLKVYEHKFRNFHGWDILSTSTPTELVEVVYKEKPDLIVTDIILKNGSAYDAIEEIKASKDKKIRSIPIIILTDLKQEEDRIKAKELGATEFLVKSETSFDEVVKKVKDIQTV